MQTFRERRARRAKRDELLGLIATLTVGGAALFAAIRWWLWPWLLTPTVEQRELTAKIALIGILALPIAAFCAYQLGVQTGWEKHTQAGRSEAWGLASRTIANERERAPERANDYLAGAKKGLGIVESMTRTRAAARPTPTAAPVQMYEPLPLEYLEAGDDDYIDV